MEALLPESLSYSSVIFLIVASFFTSALTAAAGIGGGLLMLAIMTYIIPTSAIIAVHGVVQLGSNASRSWVQRAHINWNVTQIFLIGSLVGVVLGALVVVQLPSGVLKLLLGAFILAMIWVKIPALKSASRPVIALGGAVTTFITMFAGATGPLVAVFLSKIFDDHKTTVATHGATMMVQHGLKVIAFIIAGFAFTDWLLLMIAMVASGFMGVKAGTMLHNRLPETQLKLMFRIVLTVVAIDLIRRGIFAIN